MKKFERAIPYSVTIKPSENGGYIVHVGCATFVYTNPIQLCEDLQEYLSNPKEVELQYHKEQNRRGPQGIGPCETTTQSTLINAKDIQEARPEPPQYAELRREY